MSGTPSASEIQTQWKNALIVLDRLRKVADNEYVGASGYFDDLLQVLEGEYTPSGLAAFVSRFRAGLSSLASPETALEILQPVLFEYANLLGWPESTPDAVATKLRRYFAENSASVTSRGITFASTGTAGGSNVGNGVLLRLTKDRWDFAIETVTSPDTKTFRCFQDAGNGARQHAEVFLVEGKAPSFDNLGIGTHGSGIGAGGQQLAITALHCGSGNGGSWLSNASFSTYSATSTPKFDRWTEVASGSSVSQDTVNFYRSFPGAQTDGSLKLTATGGSTITLRQTLANMARKAFGEDKPMFLSVMVNITVGSAATGTFTIRLGGVSVDTSIGSIGSGWQRITLPIDQDCWYENFNDGSIDVEIEWSSSGSGYLLVDDVILQEWTEVDGTYFAIVGGTTPFLARDVFTVADTGGAPGTGVINYWLWRAGLETLPASGSPTFVDPTVP